MALPKFKATGERGSWFATVEGERLACAHRLRSNFKERTYQDEELDPKNPGHIYFYNEIAAAKKVILTEDEVTPEGGFRRLSYIGIWAVSEIAFDEVRGLTFRFADRLANLF